MTNFKTVHNMRTSQKDLKTGAQKIFIQVWFDPESISSCLNSDLIAVLVLLRLEPSVMPSVINRQLRQPWSGDHFRKTKQVGDQKGLQVKMYVIFAVSACGRPKPISSIYRIGVRIYIDWRYIVKLIIVLFSLYLT